MPTHRQWQYTYSQLLRGTNQGAGTGKWQSHQGNKKVSYHWWGPVTKCYRMLARYRSFRMLSGARRGSIRRTWNIQELCHRSRSVQGFTSSRLCYCRTAKGKQLQSGKHSSINYFRELTGKPDDIEALLRQILIQIVQNAKMLNKIWTSNQN